MAQNAIGFAKKYGLTKMPKEANNRLAFTYFGKYKNLDISVSLYNNVLVLVKVFGNFKDSVNNEDIMKRLNEIKSLKYVTDVRIETALSISLFRKFSFIKIQEIEDILDIVNDIYSDTVFITETCEVCGKNAAVNKLIASDRIDPFCTCEICKAETEKNYRHTNAKLIKQKRNYGKGFLTGLLFSLAGVFLWVLISLAGFIAGIAGYLIAYLMYLGFKKSGGKTTKFSISLILVFSIIMIVIADFISLGIIISNALADEGYSVSIVDIFINMPVFLAEEQIMTAFIRDIGIGILLTFAASYPLFKAMLEEGKRKTLYTINNQIA